MQRTVLATIALVATLLATAAPAGADSSLSVSDTTDLRDKQLVHVTATLTEVGDGLIIAQCPAGIDLSDGPAAATACGNVSVFFGSSDSVDTDYSVSREFRAYTGNARTDCLDVDCILAVSSGTIGGLQILEVLSVPISFADIPLVRATPAFHIGDETSEVTISGAHETATARLVQCIEDDPTPSPVVPGPCPVVGPDFTLDSSAVGDLAVTRVLARPDGSLVDCAVIGACRIGVQIVDGLDAGFWTIPARFSTVPKMLADPASPLVEGDAVDVELINLGIEHQVTVLSCPRTGGPLSLDPATDCVEIGATVGDAVNTFQTTVTMPRFVEFDGTAVDCARHSFFFYMIHSPCMLTAFGRTGPEPDALVRFAVGGPGEIDNIDFLTVSETTNLVDGQVIDLTVKWDTVGTGFVAQCAAPFPTTSINALSERCVSISRPHFDPDADLTFAVSRIMETPDGQWQDCRVTRCYVVVGAAPDDDSPLRARSASLSWASSTTWSFDGSVPVGESVSLTAHGVPTEQGAGAALVQCGPAAGVVGLYCPYWGAPETDFDGTFTGSFVPQATMPGPGGETIDCTEPGTCGVGVVVLGQDWTLLWSTGKAIQLVPEP